MMVVNGFFSPVKSAAFGLVWTIGRVIYGFGYKKSVKGRMVGGLLSHLGDWPLLGLTIYNSLVLLKWV